MSFAQGIGITCESSNINVRAERAKEQHGDDEAFLRRVGETHGLLEIRTGQNTRDDAEVIAERHAAGVVNVETLVKKVPSTRRATRRAGARP